MSSVEKAKWARGNHGVLIWDTVLLVFAPEKFLRRAVDHDALLPAREPLTGEALTRHRIRTIRRALFTSFAWVIAGGAVGLLAAEVLRWCVGVPSAITAMWLQAIAGALLLGGTLGVRGWDIQSYNGNTLPERVNWFVYYGLYVVGTALFTLTLRWSLPKPN